MRRALAVKFRRETDVAVVEPDDAEAGAREVADQRLRPEGHLRSKPHDEDERRAVLRTRLLILEREVVGFDLRHGWLSLFRRRDDGELRLALARTRLLLRRVLSDRRNRHGLDLRRWDWLL